MNMKEIKEMLQLMAENDLEEFELEKDGLKIKLKKMVSAKAEHSVSHTAAPHAVPVVSAASTAPHLKSAPVESTPSDVVIVRSPMVGTFYASPAPDQPTYVSIGTQVKEGDVLCIIEAMKLMNEIKCEVSGEVIEVFVKNGQPIEFDQPLFKIKP